jgi:ferredoxin
VFEAFLRQFSPLDWAAACEEILPAVHEVDRGATRIWFHFFPLALADAFEANPDTLAVTRQLRIDGQPRLAAAQIDSSHWFFYGHRHWPAVKTVIVKRADSEFALDSLDLTTLVRDLGAEAASACGVEERFVVGLAFAGLMTLRQVGLDAFRASHHTGGDATPPAASSPEALIERRAQDDGQGAFGFLRSTKRFSVIFDERIDEAKFPILDNQHLTTAAALDKRDYTRGPRKFHEGPIPSQCRSATCGTCWIGILGGQHKLSDIESHETIKLREFGYINAREPRPIIRLACQARVSGNVTIVIPPWNGLISRL